jgi:nucleoside-diphosphate-sugar epimerase
VKWTSCSRSRLHDRRELSRGINRIDLPTAHVLGERRDLVRLRPKAGIVIDLILSSGAQAQSLMDAFRGTAQRVVAASSIFGWVDDEYDKIPVERAILGDSELPGTVLRLPMIYGPADHLYRFHPVLKRIDDDRPAILFEQGWSGWRSPRGYVENVAAALALAAVSEQASGRVYNVAETPAFSELEWAGKIATAAGREVTFLTLSKEQMPAHLAHPGNSAQHWEADSTRIRQASYHI